MGALTLLRRGVFVATVKDNPLNLDYRAWGWIHIAVGVLAMVLAALLPRARPPSGRSPSDWPD